MDKVRDSWEKEIAGLTRSDHAGGDWSISECEEGRTMEEGREGGEVGRGGWLRC